LRFESFCGGCCCLFVFGFYCHQRLGFYVDVLLIGNYTLVLEELMKNTAFYLMKEAEYNSRTRGIS